MAIESFARVTTALLLSVVLSACGPQPTERREGLGEEAPSPGDAGVEARPGEAVAAEAPAGSVADTAQSELASERPVEPSVAPSAKAVTDPATGADAPPVTDVSSGATGAGPPTGTARLPSEAAESVESAARGSLAESGVERESSDPGEPVRVAAGKAGLAYVGAEKCGKCHRIQLTSWRQSAHAALEPPLDCEGCHGPGSEYQAIKVMRDPQAARAAGLVDPSAAFCQRCHAGDWDDEMLGRAHAHKSKGS